MSEKQTYFVSSRRRLVQSMMGRTLESRTLEELQALAKDNSIPYRGVTTKQELVEALTNASRAAVPPPRKVPGSEMKTPPDARAGVVHVPTPAPVQEGGSVSGEAPEDVRKGPEAEVDPITEGEE